MANTYTQIRIHFVFAVKDRTSVIAPTWRDDLHRYITGVAKEQRQRVLAIGGVSDHVHLFVGLTPTMAPSTLMAHVKRASSTWVNENKLSMGHFGWQEGFGAFSYAASQTDAVVRYIMGQEEHHKTHTFREEFETFLTRFGIAHDEKYVFHDI
ncbi:MAG: IS200/IS605 family transposase [Kiritimatiellae bacterium]|nr:IS200/IS605 family transposase [Kiritimatiellia bacterium]